MWSKAKAKVLGTAKPGATAESFLTAKGRDKVCLPTDAHGCRNLKM